MSRYRTISLLLLKLHKVCIALSSYQNRRIADTDTVGASLTQKAKAAESKGAEEVNMANKAVRNEEAESFRGVHLDPNAHHWDEVRYPL